MIIAVLMAGGKGKRMDSDIEKPLFNLFNKPLIDHVLENLKKSNYIESIVVAVSPHTTETKKYLNKKSFNELKMKNIIHVNDDIDSIKNISNKKTSEDISENYSENISNNIDNNSNNTNYYYYYSKDDINNKIFNSFNNYIETPGEGYLNDLAFLLSYFEEIAKENILLFINTDLPFVFSKIIDHVLEKYMKTDKEAMSVLVPESVFEKHGITPSYSFEGNVPSGLNILISKNKVQDEEKIIISQIELALNINTIDDVEIANCLFKN
ncbi:Adenosylcobinamide-phosphate guanylyltransferase [Candidatus Methanobinarius endosymbioticus]|uniref:Adenosylcobinamide-phosphate guanylyltransferase n=1 Tax=Candidatus Methanobinarius endosymbioticus TaxID=2006182 RepID=A0A366M964_9EURY|nr:Adenosylcobinamide-phosphate guanylyltransferase [Candidatus Methanobinarius endosymbioticus]